MPPKANKKDELIANISEPKGVAAEIDIEEKTKKPTESALKRFYRQVNLQVENLSSVPLTEKLFFTKNLQVMLKAGISLSAALKILSEQTSNKKLSRTIKDVSMEVEKGNSFSVALKKYPRIFNSFFTSMIEGGEISGKIEESLIQLYKQMAKDSELISKVRGAMIYPIIVLTAMLGIGIATIVFIVPQLTAVFEESGATLPMATQILIAISDFLANNGLISALALIIIITGFIYTIRTPKGKFYWHLFLLKLPVFGPIVKKINLARFSRTFSSLLKTDIPIVQTLTITSNVLGNVHYKAALTNAREKIKEGLSIKESLTAYKNIFPLMVQQMIAVGEESGALDDILDELANFYEEEVNDIMNTLPSIIEPLLMIMLGFGVGGMAIAIIMPMYSLSEQI